MIQKVKQDICIGKNIRKLRLRRGIGQTDFVKRLQLRGCDITRESLVKIERGIQHIHASQLICIKTELNVSYDEIFSQTEEEK